MGLIVSLRNAGCSRSRQTSERCGKHQSLTTSATTLAKIALIGVTAGQRCKAYQEARPDDSGESVEIGLASKVQIGLPCANLTRLAQHGDDVSHPGYDTSLADQGACDELVEKQAASNRFGSRFAIKSDIEPCRSGGRTPPLLEPNQQGSGLRAWKLAFSLRR